MKVNMMQMTTTVSNLECKIRLDKDSLQNSDNEMKHLMKWIFESLETWFSHAPRDSKLKTIDSSFNFENIGKSGKWGIYLLS